MALPLTVRSNGPAGIAEKQGKTRDVSFRGLFFTTDGEYQPGTQIEFVLMLPKEITQAADVNIRCYGQVLRVELNDKTRGIAARIDRYEFLNA